ncbi:hypothetical protein RvY_11970 [Ramazzottius varieornatus]|uniref:Uncharacterized protein n=1 Tax=Ramazzottius varieornatus TaxID=947166 RepID=A0A1D1VRQ3_RAMVA|nr:hypothetical protein RvY_11970 [Ramazzottius varieornatus]
MCALSAVDPVVQNLRDHRRRQHFSPADPNAPYLDGIFLRMNCQNRWMRCSPVYFTEDRDENTGKTPHLFLKWLGDVEEGSPQVFFPSSNNGRFDLSEEEVTRRVRGEH